MKKSSLHKNWIWSNNNRNKVKRMNSLLFSVKRKRFCEMSKHRGSYVTSGHKWNDENIVEQPLKSGWRIQMRNFWLASFVFSRTESLIRVTMLGCLSSLSWHRALFIDSTCHSATTRYRMSSCWIARSDGFFSSFARWNSYFQIDRSAGDYNF